MKAETVNKSQKTYKNSRSPSCSGLTVRNAALAAAITAGVILIIFVLRGISPFGDRSILTIDCFHQYAPFLLEVRHRILSGKSLFYSCEAGLGRDLFVQSAYYTAAPLDYLVLLIKPEQISSFTALLIGLKMSLCAASFSFYLNMTYARRDAADILLGVLYAFCGFISCFYWNIMWLDITAVFPVLIWSVETMLDRHTPAARIRYSLVLAALMILNFYLAFIVCLFLIPFYVKHMLASPRTRGQWRTSLLEFIGFSVLAAMLAAFLLMPSAIAIRRTRSEDAALPSFRFYLSLFQLPAAHFSGARPSVMSRNQDAPNIFSGALTLLLIPVYIRHAPGSRREKMCNLGFAAFLLLCCVFEPLDYLAHGLYFPANMPHRYSFIYSFALLCMAYEAAPWIQRAGKRELFGTAAVWSALLLITDRVITPRLADYESVLDNRELVGNLILLFVYAALLYGYGSVKMRTGRHTARQIRLICGSAALLMVLECGYMFHNSIEITTSAQAYTEHMKDTADAMEVIRTDSGKSLRRSEYARTEAINEGSIYHFNGFSTFSSMVPGNLTSLMQSLGVAAGAKTFRYYDATPLLNTLFDIGYLYSPDGRGIRSDMTSAGEYGTISLWKNENTPALGYMTRSSVLNWDTQAGDPFEVQNSFVSEATGVDGNMFTSLAASRVNLDNGAFLSTDGVGGFDYQLDDPYDLDRVPQVTAVYEIPQSGDLYLYVNSAQTDSVTYYTDTETQTRELGTGNETIHIGDVSKGETVTVTFALDKKGDFDTHYTQNGQVQISMAFYHDDVLDEAQTFLSASRWDPEQTKDTYLSGTVNVKEAGILFTSVPYSDGWTVRVDGKAVKAQTVGGALIGVALDTGKHTVTMQYQTPGLKSGIIISIAGTALIVLYGFWAGRNAGNKKKDNNESKGNKE